MLSGFERCFVGGLLSFLWKTLWEERFTGKEYLFLSVNMKNGGRHKFRKYKDIEGSDKYVTLDISSKFDEMYKVMYFSLPLISLCFLTFQRPQFLMFINRNKSSLPVNVSFQNVFRVEQP